MENNAFEVTGSSAVAPMSAPTLRGDTSGMLTVMASAALYRRNRAAFLDAITAVFAVLAVLGTLLVIMDAAGIAVPGHRFTMQVATNRVALATPFGLAEDYSRVGSRFLRLQSFFDEPGTASMVLVPAAGLAMLTRRRRRAFVLIVAGVLTFSIGALAGILLGGGFALLRGRRGRWAAQMGGVVLGAVGAVLAVPALTHYVKTKITDGGKTTSAKGPCRLCRHNRRTPTLGGGS